MAILGPDLTQPLFKLVMSYQEPLPYSTNLSFASSFKTWRSLGQLFTNWPFVA